MVSEAVLSSHTRGIRVEGEKTTALAPLYSINAHSQSQNDELKGLNVLAAYTYYDTFNKLQFYSSTADEIGLLASIEGFDTIQLIFDETHRMNNYKTIMNDALQYLSDVDERRDKHATNETLHRSRH